MERYAFDSNAALSELIGWLRAEGKRANFNKVVIGISGGKDSTIAAALCCRAFGAENVHGLLMPNGIQKDINDSIRVCEALGIKYTTINIKPMYDSFVMQYNMCCSDTSDDVEDARDNKLTNDALINLAPRVRMVTLRLWAQTNHHRVCGTSNFSEITVGYCTKDGDTCADFNPLGKLTSVEVVEIGELLTEIPKDLVLKTPEDGLSGMSDEKKLGVTYDEIHKYARSLPGLSREVWDKIHALAVAGLHKRTSVPTWIPPESIMAKASNQQISI